MGMQGHDVLPLMEKLNQRRVHRVVRHDIDHQKMGLVCVVGIFDFHLELKVGYVALWEHMYARERIDGKSLVLFKKTAGIRV